MVEEGRNRKRRKKVINLLRKRTRGRNLQNDARVKLEKAGSDELNSTFLFSALSLFQVLLGHD